MDVLNILYVTITGLAVLLVSITIWSRRPFKWRLSAFLIGVAFVTIIYASILELLSRPKPAHMELFYKDVPEVVLLHASWGRRCSSLYFSRNTRC